MVETKRLNDLRVCPDCKTSVNPYVLASGLEIESVKEAVYTPPGGLVLPKDTDLAARNLECPTCSCHWHEAYAK